jgi:hypothetical protein
MANKQLFFGERIGPHRIRTDEGYLIACRIPVARTGWQRYKASELQIDNLNPETLVDVYRDAADVFDPVSMATAEGKSITKKHPTEFLNADNDRDHACGHAQNVQRGERLPDGNEALFMDLFVKDSNLINYINTDMMAEVSMGYRYNLVPYDDGNDEGPRLQMKDIRYNHVAIVPKARGGEHLRILDAEPEEGSNKMEWKDFVSTLKEAGLRLVTARDAESETVENQHKQMREMLKLKSRTMDADTEEEEKKKEEEKKEEKEAKDALIKRLDAQDAMLKKLADGMEELAKKDEEPKEAKKEGEDAKCTCDAKEGEAHKEACPMFKKAEDADLIAVATLPKEERPKNPIPGADAAISNLRALKPIIAASGDKKAIDGFNAAMRMLKGGGKVEDAFALIEDAKASGRDKVTFVAQDAAAIARASGAAYEEEMKKHHRKSVTVN